MLRDHIHLIQPMLLVQGFYDFAIAWWMTRRWLLVVLLHAPWLLLVATVFGIVLYGATMHPPSLAQRYDQWIANDIPQTLEKLEPVSPSSKEETEANSEFQIEPLDDVQPPAVKKQAGYPENESVADSDLTVETITDSTRLLLRRRFQLPDAGEKIVFLVASQVLQADRSTFARQLMRQLAPVDKAGFVPAHAWLANDRLNRGVIDSVEELKEITHDLEIAVSSKLSDRKLVSTYAELLEKTGNASEAINALEQAREEDSSLAINMRIAKLSARHGRLLALTRASDAAKKEIRQKMETGSVTSNDFADLAHLFLLEKNPTQARKVATRGLQTDAENPQLKRLLSESYRFEYIASFGKDTLDTKLLTTALQADPTNPAISVETARLVAMGQSVSPELKNNLDQLIQNDKAMPMTHVFVADGLIAKGEISQAIPQLESALKKDPQNTNVMNNLALALAKTDPAALERALKLSVDAVRRNPNNIEFIDTLGEIRALTGDKAGAVECYEHVIKADGAQMKTRQRLAALYRELGMIDLAENQERAMSAIETP